MEDLINNAVRLHKQDIAHIGAIVSQFAVDHEYVELYNDTVAELNKQLTFPLPLCKREYEVTARLTVSVTVTVDALSEEDAIDRASRESYGLSTHSDWDVIDWDEEEISAELA